jgi:hypothetical protein
MSNTRWLARLLKWVFLVFTVFMGIAALAIVVVLVVDPKLPHGTRIGTFDIEMLGQTGTVVFKNATLNASMFHNGVSARVDDANGLFDLVKHIGLPVALLSVLYFAGLFELMRRLFRNVVRGESFTRQTMRLVQVIGLSLVVYSIVSMVAEGWFQYELYGYLANHATVLISGAQIHLPQPDGYNFKISGGGSPFGSPYFFTGLLVLALSEVFRQGLVLKNENDLTV